MGIIHLEQGTETWHQWRKSNLGASHANVIVAKVPPSFAITTWDDLRNVKEHGEESMMSPSDLERMRIMTNHGVSLEPLARALAERLYKIKYPPICAQHETDSRIACSLDGFDIDIHRYRKEAPRWLEIKCPYKGIDSHMWKKRNVNTKSSPVFWQLCHQAYVLSSFVPTLKDEFATLLVYIDDTTFHVNEFMCEDLLDAAESVLVPNIERFLNGEQQFENEYSVTDPNMDAAVMDLDALPDDMNDTQDGGVSDFEKLFMDDDFGVKGV